MAPGDAGALQAELRGRELGPGGEEGEKQGRRTLRESRKGQNGAGNGGVDGEQGRGILPGKEGQDGTVRVQEELKEEQEVNLGVEVEMKAPALQMPTVPNLTQLVPNLVTASASATSPGTRNAGEWVTLCAGEEQVARLEKEVEMTLERVDQMQIALRQIPPALSLAIVSVSATSLGIQSAGGWVTLYVVEVEEAAVVAEIAEVVEGEVVVELLQVVEGEEWLQPNQVEEEEVVKKVVAAKSQQEEAKREAQGAKQVEGEVGAVKEEEVEEEGEVEEVAEEMSKVNVPLTVTALHLTPPARNGVTANVRLTNLVILTVGDKAGEEEAGVPAVKVVVVVVVEVVAVVLNQVPCYPNLG